MKKVLALILAGGKGERLYPLTRDRTKPAVPFGAIYRIIDFTLSNCINSNLRKIYILSQYKSLSLNRHIQLGWNILSSTLGEFITVVPAQQRVNEQWYEGTADAIYQNIYLLQKDQPDLLLILSGDHVYKMDYREMINFHLEKGADATVGTAEMDKGLSKEFGVIEIDDDYRITFTLNASSQTKGNTIYTKVFDDNDVPTVEATWSSDTVTVEFTNSELDGYVNPDNLHTQSISFLALLEHSPN